jgi:hypothetical protein
MPAAYASPNSIMHIRAQAYPPASMSAMGPDVMITGIHVRCATKSGP